MNDLTDGILDRARHQVRPRSLPERRYEEDDWSRQAARITPRRLYRGPIMEMTSPRRLFDFDADDLDAWRSLSEQVPNWRRVRALAEYWTDGNRNLAEIAHLVELESGQRVGEAIETWFRLLALAGLMTLEEK